MDEAKRGLIESRAVNRAQDHILASHWFRVMDTKHNWSFAKDMDEKVGNLTVEDVNRAIRRIADPVNFTVAVVSDVERAKNVGKDSLLSGIFIMLFNFSRRVKHQLFNKIGQGQKARRSDKIN